MKFTTRLFLFWVSIFLAFFIGIIVVINFFWTLPINIWQMLVVFFIVGVIPPAAITAFFYKRLNYMESESIESPKFSGYKEVHLHFKARTSNHFDEIMQRIDREWIISFSDRKNGVLKFRTDARMTAWGIGGYVKPVNDDTVLVVVYPIFPHSKHDERIMNQTIHIMTGVLSP
jgi:hypothetical protein